MRWELEGAEEWLVALTCHQTEQAFLQVCVALSTPRKAQNTQSHLIGGLPFQMGENEA